jgi:hypothetical protein
MSVRDRLIEFYQNHNPSKLCDVDVILDSFDGHEDEMFAALEVKYGLHVTAVPAAQALSAEAASPQEALRHQFERLQLQLARLVQLDMLSLLNKNSSHDPALQDVIATVASFQNLAANFVEDCIPFLDQLSQTAATTRPRTGPVAMTTIEAGEPHAVVRPDGTRSVELVARDGSVGHGLLTSLVLGDTLRAGDIVVLHPGTYHENLRVCAGQRLDVRPAFEGAAVSILPLDDALPCCSVEDGAVLRVTGITVAASRQAVRTTVPLVCCASATVELDECQLIGGGGAVLASGKSTVAVTRCTIRGSAFAGIYLKEGAFGTISDSEITAAEVALRVRDSSFSMIRCNVHLCSSDGVTCHGAVQGVLEGSTVSKCKDNGIMLSPRSAVMVTTCSISDCAQYGVYAPTGAEFALISSKLSGNTLGNYNRCPPSAVQVDAFSVGGGSQR